MPAANFVAGFGQTVTINSVAFCVTNGKWSETNDPIEVTGNCSAGKKQFIPGLSVVTGSFDLNYDTANPITIAAGAYFALNHILNSTQGTQGLACAAAQVVSRDYSTPVPGAVTCTVNFQTSGPYTITTV